MSKIAWKGIRAGVKREIEDLEGKYEKCEHPFQFQVPREDELRQVCKGCKRDLFVRFIVDGL
jgi:hypothetical protein